jgi:hypothetical protein
VSAPSRRSRSLPRNDQAPMRCRNDLCRSREQSPFRQSDFPAQPTRFRRPYGQPPVFAPRRAKMGPIPAISSGIRRAHRIRTVRGTVVILRPEGVPACAPTGRRRSRGTRTCRSCQWRARIPAAHISMKGSRLTHVKRN